MAETVVVNRRTSLGELIIILLLLVLIGGGGWGIWKILEAKERGFETYVIYPELDGKKTKIPTGEVLGQIFAKVFDPNFKTYYKFEGSPNWKQKSALHRNTNAEAAQQPPVAHVETPTGQPGGTGGACDPFALANELFKVGIRPCPACTGGGTTGGGLDPSRVQAWINEAGKKCVTAIEKIPEPVVNITGINAGGTTAVSTSPSPRRTP